MTIRHLTPFLLLFTMGCGEGTEPSSPGLQEWTFQSNLRIGSLDDPQTGLGQVLDLTVGPDESVYVLEVNEQSIRVFDGDGRFRRVIGRKGGGPGEFSNTPGAWGWLADTLWVFDSMVSRFSLFSADGDLIRDFRVIPLARQSRDDHPLRPRGMLPDGSILGRSGQDMHQVAIGNQTVEHIARLSLEGGVTDTLGQCSVQNSALWVRPPDQPEHVPMGSYSRQPFGNGDLTAFPANIPAWFTLRRPEPNSPSSAFFSVSKIGLKGDTVWSRELPYSPLPTDEEVVSAWVDEETSAVVQSGSSLMRGATAAEYEEWLRHALFVPRFQPPAFQLLVDRSGSIWIRTTDAREGRNEWLVLDKDGEPMARASTRASVRVKWVSQDRIWGIETDDLDVNYIVRLRRIESTA